MENLRERGVEHIDLIIFYALTGIENAVCSSFLRAKHQLCVVPLKRNLAAAVSHKDKFILLSELKDIFPVGEKDTLLPRSLRNLLPLWPNGRRCTP